MNTRLQVQAKTTPTSSFTPVGRNLLPHRSTEQAEPPLVPPILHDMLPKFQAKLTKMASGEIRRTPNCQPSNLQQNCDLRQWQEINPGLQAAKRMVDTTLNNLTGVARLLICLRHRQDPRISCHGNSHQMAMQQLFRMHFKSGDPFELLTIEEQFQRIQRVLNSLSRIHFRCVSQDCCDQDKEGRETYAFVLDNQTSPPIYLCPAFFPGAISTLATLPSGATISTTGATLTPEQKGMALIHEVAHLNLGIRHSGGDTFDFTINCDSGYSVRNFRNASTNAYVYAHFAYCASRI